MKSSEIGRRVALRFRNRLAAALLCCLLILVVAPLSFGQKPPSVDVADPGKPPVALKMTLDPGVKSDVQRIKSSPLYKDEALAQANWFERALEGFGNWISKFLNRHSDDGPSAPGWTGPSLLGPWVIYVMWALLAGAALTFLFFAVRMFRWRITLTRKAKTMLEEDEPERTLDEWLERAAMLESQGHYREAVRCLYLACLLKFDELGVARFDRGQTNWEHLRRIEASPNLPGGIDFRPATRAFDLIWYGMRVNGAADVARFRAWYQEISAMNLRKAA